ncbi:OmpH family outer membrane protein [Duncaniella muricolitica]|mgnify:FL=1|jgi:outer membrane protein|uniref:OmpH family outer membrane protein n=1 Tax=Duncaniella muricolitica TaxID=2880704 RepID=UPI00244DF9D4|nr:OmpH family outer membrane protein [Duncaniella muricolitica]
MKKLAMSASSLLLGILALSTTACGGDPAADKSSATPASAATPADGATTINIRYIDGDSVLAHYQFAKDLQDATMRAVQRIDNARNSKGSEIQKFAASIEQKARSNGYLNEASYNADMQKLQKMQQDAENYLANLSRNADNDLGQQQIQLNDSIEKFIKEYNATRKYDAILYKNAGVYFNPELDITNEVIEGLNARYTKPAEKK